MNTEPRRIILFSKIFYPSNRIGAVRPSNFAKYLAQFGNDITVVTQENIADVNYKMPGVNIVRVSNSRFVSRIIAKNDERVQKRLVHKSVVELPPSEQPANISLIQKTKAVFRKVLSEAFELIIEYDWYRVAKRRMKKEFGDKRFDTAISSYGPLSSFLLGRYSIRKRLASSWICDLRDNMTSNVYSVFLNTLYRTFENSALKFADAIVFVSKGQKSMFLGKHEANLSAERKCHVIYNGYENRSLNVEAEENSERVLRMTYTGQLYKEKSDFRLLLEVLDQLIQEGSIDKNKIRVSYAGQNKDIFDRQVSLFPNLTGSCRNFGFVSKQDAERMQQESDLLIALVWNTTEEQGILSGKFVEYLQRRKPIIALTSGNLVNGELSEMVNEMQLGIACEYCNYDQGKASLSQFILTQYNLKISGEDLNYSPDYTKVENFKYENVTKAILKVIGEISAHKNESLL